MPPMIPGTHPHGTHTHTHPIFMFLFLFSKIMIMHITGFGGVVCGLVFLCFLWVFLHITGFEGTLKLREKGICALFQISANSAGHYSLLFLGKYECWVQRKEYFEKIFG